MGYVAIATAFLAWFILYKTKFGLRLRSVGEHPQARILWESMSTLCVMQVC